jgi:hypothetical protein
MKAILNSFRDELFNPKIRFNIIDVISKLMRYYEHQQLLYKDFEKNQEKLIENLSIMDTWILECKNLINLLKNEN